MFQNSNEFTQLGTLTKENRIAEYFPPDQQQSAPKLSERSIDIVNDSGRNQMYAVGEKLREQHHEVLRDNMNMIQEKKQREAERREAENKLLSFEATGETKPIKLPENYIKMEILKNYPFPATTN